ncbi:MAG TPA: glutathione S-transferase family protein [Sphingomonadaceae bacterium]|nr:glutathione S-transferase family protein [Sphingomonadaceae bacterium]
MILLYHAEPTLYALKPLIALEELGLSYESRWIDERPVERVVPDFPGEATQAIRVEGDGPVLVDGDAMLTSSFFILEYLAQAYAEPPLAPADPYEYYQAQAIGQTVAGTIAPFVSALAVAAHPVPAGDYGDIEPVERRRAWENASASGQDITGLSNRLEPGLRKLGTLLGERDWFLPAYSIADIDVFAIVREVPALAPGLLDEVAPNLPGFCERMEARPAVQRALAKGWGSATRYLPGPEISRWG